MQFSRQIVIVGFIAMVFVQIAGCGSAIDERVQIDLDEADELPTAIPEDVAPITDRAISPNPRRHSLAN
jgi:hypothetical protein